MGSLILHLHPRYIPKSAVGSGYTWCMGGLAFLMFLIEVITGVLLMFQYSPTASTAYISILDITQVAPYGFFIRNLHYWVGQIMVVFVVIHAIRVIITNSYAPPRRFNWLIGVGLLLSVLLIDFTGYLLIWDDRSLWAWTIARNLAASAPLIGSSFSAMLFGPSDVGDAVLIRLYAWHVFFLPALISCLVSWHFWRIRKDGISTPL